MNNKQLKERLAKYIIDKTKPQWKVKKKNINNQLVEIPNHLDGEVLLEEHTDEQGRVKGWITVSLDALAKIITDIKDSTKSDITEESTGYKKYFDKWRKEGIKIYEED